MVELKDSIEADGVSLSPEDRFQHVLKWLLLAGMSVAFSAFFAYIFYQVIFLPESWILATMRQQFAVTISMPFAAVVALFVVLLLQFSTGPIELEIPGFKLRGASGPIVLWIACFLSLVSAIKLLWLKS